MEFKSLNWLAPVYLHELFSERHTDYDLCDARAKILYSIYFFQLLLQTDNDLLVSEMK